MPVDAATPAVEPLTTKTPWLTLGISRSAWYRLAAAGRAPKPICPPGVGRVWRVADLRRWVERQTPAR